jgi:hypothetical protein
MLGVPVVLLVLPAVATPLLHAWLRPLVPGKQPAFRLVVSARQGQRQSLIDSAGIFVTGQICHHLFVRWVRTATNRSDTIYMPAMARQLMLCSLPPDVLHVIVRLSCSDMHSKAADAAAAAQDTATALRLTCRTLKAAVDTTVAELVCLDIRASSSVDIAQAAALFPGLQGLCSANAARH